MQDLVYWIWLSLSVTKGSENFRKLFEIFGSAEDIYKADRQELTEALGSRCADLNALSDKDTEYSLKVLNYCKDKNIGILTYIDDRFPNSLREIKNPPVLLYYRGCLPDFNSECFISVVGTRRLTDYGRRNAFSIGRDLAKSGAILVSGMAIGIDGVATAGALSVNAPTVSFLGCGINICYPDVHLTLAKSIVENGCILTEYSPGARPEKTHFPIRNRLISGLSYATVVIEGGEKSGSFITARKAKEQGRDVYALPGNVDNKTSAVSNLLIRDGAKLILNAQDIIRDIEYKFLGKINPFKVDEPNEISIDDALSKYKVCCVTHSDGVFSSRKSTRTRTESVGNEVEEKNESIRSQTDGQKSDSAKSISEAGFDKETLEIYLKIPPQGEVPVLSLADEKHDLKTVMRAMFRLDIGKFVIMLPGEKVKRNI